MLFEKLQLLHMFQSDKRDAAVDHCCVVNGITKIYIKKNEAAIMTTVDVSFCGSAKRLAIVRSKHFVRVESASALRISDCK